MEIDGKKLELLIQENHEKIISWMADRVEWSGGTGVTFTPREIIE